MEVQEMRDAREKAVVIFSKFCNFRSEHPQGLFCFYEGEDKKYYCSRIEHYTSINPYDIISFNCGGKSNVLKIRKMIKDKSEYKDVKTAYFIDRDFFAQDELQDDVYETEGYSVENYYTSITAFGRILNVAFGINYGSEDFVKAIDDYENTKKIFHEHTLFLNAWLKCQRKMERKDGKRRVILSRFHVSKYYSRIGIDNIELKYKIDDNVLLSNFPESYNVSIQEVEEEIDKFKESDVNKSFRGKFELELLKRILEDLRNKNKTGGYFSEEYECVKIEPNIDTLMSLSQFADTPDDLIVFLKRYNA